MRARVWRLELAIVISQHLDYHASGELSSILRYIALTSSGRGKGGGLEKLSFARLESTYFNIKSAISFSQHVLLRIRYILQVT